MSNKLVRAIVIILFSALIISFVNNFFSMPSPNLGLEVPDAPIETPDIPEEDTMLNYVSLGDSIAVGYSMPDWNGEQIEYGVNGNTVTKIVDNSYTDLIYEDLTLKYGAENVMATSFARSGDTVEDLMNKLDNPEVISALEQADYVTVCIGANDVLEPALMHLEDYINYGDLTQLQAIVEANLTALRTDDSEYSYRKLLEKLSSINPDAQYVFTTIYNPYKYLWLDEGSDGFFKPILDLIPDMTVLWVIEVDELIKDGLLSTDIVQKLFDRVNGLDDWSETYVTKLNQIIREEIESYKSINNNFHVVDVKSAFEQYPDRSESADVHYNDLVNVEFTRGYTTATMDWGALWIDCDGSTMEEKAANYWIDLAGRYLVNETLNIEGLANELVLQTVEKVIKPNVDPHPEEYGHYVMEISLSIYLQLLN